MANEPPPPPPLPHPSWRGFCGVKLLNMHLCVTYLIKWSFLSDSTLDYLDLVSRVEYSLLSFVWNFSRHDLRTIVDEILRRRMYFYILGYGRQQIGHENRRLKVVTALSLIARSFPSHGRIALEDTMYDKKKKKKIRGSGEEGRKKVSGVTIFGVFPSRRLISLPMQFWGIWNIGKRNVYAAKDRPQLFRGFIVPSPPFFSHSRREKERRPVTETWAR